jgi:predicted ArsR family transcriptional regulator
VTGVETGPQRPEQARRPRQARRTAVAGLLREADTPLGVSEVAERLGVHPNTARFHLDALVSEGQAERAEEQLPGPGRPRTVYRRRPGMDRGGARSYHLLARMLLGHLATASPDADAAAEEAGRTWGGFLVDRPPPARRLTDEQAVERLTELLGRLGFAPESEGGSDGPECIRLRHCPFLELAEEYGSLVCNVHLGLMRGALTEVDAPIAVARLEPFAEDGVCLTRLEPMAAG